MYQHILIPTDGSTLSRVAVQQGAALAKALGARVTLVTVSAPYAAVSVEPLYVASTTEDYERMVADVARKVLDEGAAAVKEAGVACDTRQVVHAQPWQAIIDAARDAGCDLIAMASHGRSGLAAVVLGSETTKVLTHSRIPVLVYR
jgi:nucleotide-binding universal stress UspA family protein